eukprot:CAMPEP_0119309754 /NCGR_PEP_ID=MMETSP1333-20130426/16494_1 /TAXON_ID=418940 /ORGANISM="Scyphosphaera apsteinii, Strain RCC1455" /LENGTH=86 /DNA_ID=CAMNT_0007313777 /DNA_START=32 /DNA_END=292 /DNA_ORIENTATION=-
MNDGFELRLSGNKSSIEQHVLGGAMEDQEILNLRKTKLGVQGTEVLAKALNAGQLKKLKKVFVPNPYHANDELVAACKQRNILLGV